MRADRNLADLRLPGAVGGARATTTAASRAASPAGSCVRATRSSVLPAGREHDDRADRHLRRAGRGGVPADVGDRRARRRARRRPRRPVCAPADPPPVARRSRPVCWMAEEPVRESARYLLKHTTRRVRARVESLDGRLDLETLSDVRAPAELELNDIGRLHVDLAAPVMAERTREPRHRRLHPDRRGRTRRSAPGWCWPRTRIRDRRAGRTAPTSSGTSRRSHAASAGRSWRCAAPPCG